MEKHQKKTRTRDTLSASEALDILKKVVGSSSLNWCEPFVSKVTALFEEQWVSGDLLRLCAQHLANYIATNRDRPDLWLAYVSNPPYYNYLMPHAKVAGRPLSLHFDPYAIQKLEMRDPIVYAASFEAQQQKQKKDEEASKTTKQRQIEHTKKELKEKLDKAKQEAAATGGGLHKEKVCPVCKKTATRIDAQTRLGLDEPTTISFYCATESCRQYGSKIV